jgi:hypothetical protein
MIFGRNRHDVTEMTTYRGVKLSLLLTKYYVGDKIEKNELGRACSTYGEKRYA